MYTCNKYDVIARSGVLYVRYSTRANGPIKHEAEPSSLIYPSAVSHGTSQTSHAITVLQITLNICTVKMSFQNLVWSDIHEFDLSYKY